MNERQSLLNEDKYGLKCSRRMNSPSFITIHETNSMKSADEYAEYMKNGYFPESAHFIVDEDEVIQLVPLTRIAHACGDGNQGPGNTQSISIEICRNESRHNERYEKSKMNAAELVRKLMKQYSISADHIVQHNHWDGSDCPKRIRREGTWEAFLSLCQEIEEGKELE